MVRTQSVTIILLNDFIVYRNLPAKLRKVESRTKDFNLFYAETEYLRHFRWQSYGKTQEKYPYIEKKL